MNFCSNCGAKVQANAKFCIGCGSKLDPAATTPSSLMEIASTEDTKAVDKETVSSPAKPGKSKKFFIFTAIAVLFLAVAGVSYGFLFNKSPKELYFTAELNGYKNTLQSFQELYGESWELSKHMSENAYRSVMAITGQMEGNNIPELDEINRYLQNSSLQVTTSLDPKLSKGMASLSLLMNGSNVLEVEAFQSDNQTAVSVPFLFNEYFYINNDDFGYFMRQMDPYYYGPEELENVTHYLNQSNQFEKDFLKHGLDYLSFITSSLEDDSFEVIDTTFRGEKARRVTLTLSEQEVRSFLNGLITKLEGDDALQELIIEQVRASMNGPLYEGISSNDMKRELRNGLTEMRNGLRYAAFPDGFKSELTIDKKNQIVQRNTTFSVADADYPREMITVSYQSSNWNNETQKEFSVTPADVRDGSLKAYWNTNERGSTLSTNAGVEFIDYGDVAVDIRLVMDTKKDKNTTETTFDLILGGYELGYDAPSISGTVKQTIDQNLSRNFSNQNFDITLNIGIEDYWYGYQEVMVNVAIDSKTEFTKNLNFPQLTPATAKNVVELSEYEWWDIMEEIGYSLESIFAGLEWY